MEFVCPKCNNTTWHTVISEHAWQCRTCGFLKKENFWQSTEEKKWDREQDTSKKAQGITTPPSPRYKRTSQGALRCHCLYRGQDLYQLCVAHQAGLHLAEQVEKDMEEKKKQQTVPTPENTPTPPATPWVENVGVSDAVNIGIVTPGEQNG